MSDNNPNFTATVSHYLVHLVETAKERVRWPVSALGLLCFFIELSARMEDNGLMKLSLTDLPKFERTLEDLAQSSSELELVLTREGRSVSLADANLVSRDGLAPKKRKRFDEDDSGEDEPNDDTSSAILSRPGQQDDRKILQHLHNLLDAPSAKSRLLAKRVRMFQTKRLDNGTHSFIVSIG
jgi:hypothetical protein